MEDPVADEYGSCDEAVRSEHICALTRLPTEEKSAVYRDDVVHHVD